MQYRTIADGKLTVSAVCLGCWAIVGDETWGRQEKSDAIAAIRAAVEVGVTFFDTAEGYGAGYSEQLLAEALGSDRARVVIGSKVSSRHLDPKALTAACERSLANLGSDYIDVYHIHWPSRTVPLERTVRAMENLVAAGKVRHIAVSNFACRGLQEVLPLARPAVNQLPYSLLWRALELEILPACRSARVPVSCYSPLAQGLLTGKFASPEQVPPGRARTRLFSSSRPQARHGEPGAEQETFRALAAMAEVARQARLDMAGMSLAWLLAQDGVASVVAGGRNAAQVRANAAAGDIILPADALARLEEITRPLRDRLGPNPDMWEHQSRMC